MRRFSLLLVIFFSICFQSFAHIGHYNNLNYLEYELFRNNKPIGYHKYYFKREKAIEAAYKYSDAGDIVLAGRGDDFV